MSFRSSFILRHRTVASAAAATGGRLPVFANLIRRLSIAAAKHRNPNNVSKRIQNPSHKNLLKAKRIFKDYSSLAPILSKNDSPPLSESQAIGLVAASQANIMRVIVPSISSSEGEECEECGSKRMELMCFVRDLLKKIKRRVMVGDKVLVGSVDWVDRRGMIENVFERNSEILDPPVANVDHLLVFFSLDQPKPEAFSLTRFLVEAESTRLPVTLALNKTELVDQQVKT